MKIVMAAKELSRSAVMEQIKNKMITCKEAAVRSQLSLRQVLRLFKRYKQWGTVGLKHGNRGKPNSRKMLPEVKAKIIQLMQAKYLGFGPQFASEKLKQCDNVIISREALRKLMIAHGLWQKQRKRKPGRKWRPRMQ